MVDHFLRTVGCFARYACLAKAFSLPAREPASLPQGEGKLHRARLATIGPMTMVYLREELGLAVEAVAESPNAEFLVVALLSSE